MWLNKVPTWRCSSLRGSMSAMGPSYGVINTVGCGMFARNSSESKEDKWDISAASKGLGEGRSNREGEEEDEEEEEEEEEDERRLDGR